MGGEYGRPVADRQGTGSGEDPLHRLEGALWGSPDMPRGRVALILPGNRRTLPAVNTHSIDILLLLM